VIYKLNDEYYVRRFRPEDLKGKYPSWFEDQEVCRYNSHGKFTKTESHFEKYLEALDKEEIVLWAICHTSDGHIGNVSLQSLSFINRTAEFAIIIGDKSHQRRDVGKLAANRILDHGFSKLNLNRIYCGTAITNEGMKALAISLGMKEEGVRRSHLYLNRCWVDVVDYGILYKEFFSNLEE